jgi:hypothetical protein
MVIEILSFIKYKWPPFCNGRKYNLMLCKKTYPISHHTRTNFEVGGSIGYKAKASYVKKYSTYTKQAENGAR